MYKCPGCGAGVRFDPASQQVVCDYCGRSMDPHDAALKNTLTASENEDILGELPEGEEGFQAMMYSCPNCGGELYSTDETAATFCSYCGASVLLESRITTISAPRRIIPFKLTKEQCAEAYKKKLKSAVFAPSSMKKSDRIQQFRGIYMPYWIYDFAYSGQVTGTGTVKKVRGNYEITSHYRVTQEAEAAYKGIAYDAASNFSDSLSQAASPFRVSESEDFTPAYMSGFYADVSDVRGELYQQQAREEAGNYMASQAVKNPGFSKHNVSSSSVARNLALRPDAGRKGMFPVWFLAVRSASGKRVSYAVVNGQTGKVAADLPIAFYKYIIGSLLLSVPIFFLLNSVLTMTPVKFLLASLIISGIGFFIMNSIMNRAYAREYNLDDKGYRSVHKVITPEDEKRAEQEDEAEKKAKKGKKKKTSHPLLTVVLFVFGILAMAIISEALSDVNFDLIIMCCIGAPIIFFVIFFVLRPGKSAVKTKASMAHKMKVLWKPVAGMAVVALVYLWDPVQDMYFYGAAIISMALMLWSAFDIVNQHNRQTMRQLPQFNRRGGNRNA